MNHLPFWKSGTGHYGNTLGQNNRNVAFSCCNLVLSLLDSIPVKKDGVFTIADYATNDGYSSLPLIESMIDHLHMRHGRDLPIQIIYEDQEGNDFNSLFNTLCGDSSYMSKFSNVYPMATNVNFYNQCVPDGTCDIIFTSFATNWLESVDMTFEDCVFDVLATKEERARLSVKGEKDWTKFLLLRARELKPGGLLVSVHLSTGKEDNKGEDTPTVAVDKGGQKETAHQFTSTIDLYVDMEAAWKELKDENMITQEEYKRCMARQILRTAKECKSPFENEPSVVRQAGLNLIHFDQFWSQCGFKTVLSQTQEKAVRDEAEDRAYYAEILVRGHRVWSNSTFLSALSDMRTEEEKAAILDELYKRIQARVMAKDPWSYRTEVLVSTLVARKGPV